MFGIGKGILSLLQGMGKGGRKVFSPATQARNLTGGQIRKSAGPMATKLTEAKSKSLRHAAALYEDLVKRGVVNTNVRREDIIRKMDQYLSREYEDLVKRGVVNTNVRKGGWNPDIPDASNLPTANFLAFPQELIRSLGDKAVWAALGGAAGYGVGRNQEAIQEMLNAVQLPQLEGATEILQEAPEQTDSDLWGPKVAEGLMDIISPIPRQ